MNPEHTPEFIEAHEDNYRVHRLSEKQLVRMENWLAGKGIQQRFGPHGAVDHTGKSYTSLYAGGVKEEGAELPTIQVEMDEDAQILHYIIALDSFVGEDKLIVWRIRPMVVSWTDDMGRQCSTIRARLTSHATPASN